MQPGDEVIVPAYTWTRSSGFPVKATDFPRSELHRKPPLV